MSSSSLSSAEPRIAIVGGGPAGLALGFLLHTNHIPYTIFELRQKPTDSELSQPSGMLDLHEGSGLDVIRACGLFDEFMALTGECSQDFVFADRTGKILGNVMAGSALRPEISRNNLSRLLFSHLPPDSIKWGHKLLSAARLETPSSTRGGGSTSTSTSTSTNRVETELTFDTGKQRFDLVVGADGAWSRIRPLLTPTQPHYSGMQMATVTICNITTKYPHLAKLVGLGSFSSLGNRHAVFCQRGPVDSLRIYLWLTIPDDEHFAVTEGLAGMTAADAKHKFLADDRLYATFGHEIKELITVACDEETADHPGQTLNTRALYTLPHGLSWDHKPGVTIVGDAAHLMLPNGEGVNAALYDSLLLSQAVTKAYRAAENGEANQDANNIKATSFQHLLEPLLGEFETAMVARATEIGKETEHMLQAMFGSKDPTADFARAFADEEPQ